MADDKARRGRKRDAYDPNRDPLVQAQRANRAKRARQHRFDPRPPTDDDWTVADEDKLWKARIPEPLGNVLGEFLGSRKWDGRVRSASVFDKWPDIVGADVARKCEVVRLAGGQLLIRAENQSWATQLGYMHVQIRRRADEVLEPGLVQEVRIIVGPLQGPATPEA